MAFVKTRAGAEPGEYEYEAAGLRWLSQAGGVRVPAVLDVRPCELHLEWIDEQGSLDWEALGDGLARTHSAGAPAHGWSPHYEIRIGPLRFPSGEHEHWAAFYAEHRIAPLLSPARDNGSLSEPDAALIESVCDRIDALAGPEEPPARLHGDLWSGNVMSGSDGPVLVDPAAYGGHREIDLAMLRLFASPPRAFFDAYGAVTPLADGHGERIQLWQLFPLLVHAVLFGGDYGARAARAARRYK